MFLAKREDQGMNRIRIMMHLADMIYRGKAELVDEASEFCVRNMAGRLKEWCHTKCSYTGDGRLVRRLSFRICCCSLLGVLLGVFFLCSYYRYWRQHTSVWFKGSHWRNERLDLKTNCTLDKSEYKCTNRNKTCYSKPANRIRSVIQNVCKAMTVY